MIIAHCALEEAWGNLGEKLVSLSKIAWQDSLALVFGIWYYHLIFKWMG